MTWYKPVARLRIFEARNILHYRHTGPRIRSGASCDLHVSPLDRYLSNPLPPQISHFSCSEISPNPFIFSYSTPINMRQLLFSILFLFAVSAIQAQSGTSYSKIMAAFDQWKATAIQKGKYASAANCKMEIVTRDGYKGPATGIPQELSIHFADINGDGKLDGLFTFHPQQCDGGNAMMNAQDRVLVLSKGSTYTADASYISNIEQKKDGWLSVTGALEGIIYGTYYEYGPDDGRCCPSIKKSFTIDYKTRKLEIEK